MKRLSILKKKTQKLVFMNINGTKSMSFKKREGGGSEKNYHAVDIILIPQWHFSYNESGGEISVKSRY